MDVSSLVRAGTLSTMDSAALDILTEVVTSAFEDAARLVMRIREQRKNTDTALPDQPTQDLLDSLALGPIIVRGHFDHDFKRFGEQFACGDAQARENMKDVLINLQMTLIIALRSSGMDLTDLDFEALQSASDDCRVNAGVCLGQLSQRLSDSAKAQAMYPIYANAPLPPLPSLVYSSSRSTHSSGYGPRTPSDNVSDRFTTLSMSTASSTRRSTGKSRKRTTGSIGSDSQNPPSVKQPVQPPVPRIATDNFGRLPAQNDADQDMAEALSIRRPSSHTLSPEDSELLSADADDGPPPRNPARSPPTQEVQRESYISSGPHSQTNSPPNISRVPSSHQKEVHRDRYGPEDFTPVAPTRPIAFPTSTEMYRVEHDEEPAPASYSVRARETNHSTLEHIQYLQQNSRPPRPNVNLFPTPPPRQQLPQPPFQSRNESLQQRAQPSHSADPLSRFPQPKKRTPPPLSSFQTMPTTSRPATSSSIPADAAPSPRQQPPPIPQFSANRNLNDSSTSLSSHAAALGIHQIHHSPTVNSTTSLPSNSHANINTLNTQSADTSRPPTSLSSNPTTTAILTTALTLPNDKTPLGFCKSATRLFLSPTSDPKHSKAFQVANRPVGFNSMVPYWGCKSCQFEGPVSTFVNVEDTGGGKKGIFGKSSSKKGREEKVFDSKVRISPGGGVRYKWIFLAKSHIPLKTHVDHVGGGRPAREGEVGGYGCLFCCAEGLGRGWVGGSSASSSMSAVTAFLVGGSGVVGNGASNASIMSDSTGSSGTGTGTGTGAGAGNGTPVFGNVATFMAHLEIHRSEEGWPGAEMRGRMKCIVGKVAGAGDDWEVNFVPLSVAGAEEKD